MPGSELDVCFLSMFLHCNYIKDDKPYMKWATDVTEFRVRDRKVYLSPIIELLNGEIISYNSSESPNFKQV